jgi:hypothetical protein
MRLTKIRHRAWLSILLSLALGSFTLSSFAASELGEALDEGISDSILVSQAPTGTLTAKGPVLLNNAEANTGATVPDGSFIQTRTGGHAIIELGAPGRVELDPITGIVLTSTPTSIEASLVKCGQGVTLVLPAGVSGLVKIRNMSDVGVLKEEEQVDVRVHKGEATVKYGQGKEKTVKAGDHEEFDNAIEVTSSGDSIVKVYCIEDHFPLLLWAGLAAIFIPIAAIGDEPPVLSVINP